MAPAIENSSTSSHVSHRCTIAANRLQRLQVSADRLQLTSPTAHRAVTGGFFKRVKPARPGAGGWLPGAGTLYRAAAVALIMGPARRGPYPAPRELITLGAGGGPPTGPPGRRVSRARPTYAKHQAAPGLVAAPTPHPLSLH